MSPSLLVCAAQLCPSTSANRAPFYHIRRSIATPKLSARPSPRLKCSATSDRNITARSAAAADLLATEVPVPWWQRPAPENVKHISTVQDMVDQLAEHREQLVIADFFAPWCAACRSLYPKLCKIAKENPDVVFLCINYEESTALVNGLNVKVLPYFHFYRGSEGRVTAFSASVSKVKMLREAIALHNTPRCSLGGAWGLEEFPDVLPAGTAALPAVHHH